MLSGEAPERLWGTTWQRLPLGKPSGNGHGKVVVLERETLRAIAEAFSSLNTLCHRAEARQIQVAEIRKELATRWRRINAKLKQGSAL